MREKNYYVDNIEFDYNNIYEAKYNDVIDLKNLRIESRLNENDKNMIGDDELHFYACLIVDNIIENSGMITYENLDMIVIKNDKNELKIRIYGEDYYSVFSVTLTVKNFFEELEELEEAEELDDKLTIHEQQFATDNHDLIYSFMNWKKLDIETYYDELCIWYLKAVKDYCRKPSAQEFKFKTIAYRAMQDGLFKLWRAESTDKRKANNTGLSFDMAIMEDSKELTLGETVADKNNYFEEFEQSEAIKDIISACTELQSKIIEMLMDGYNKSEIQKICGIGRKIFEKELETIKGIVTAMVA